MRHHRKSLLVLAYLVALVVAMLIGGLWRWLRRPRDDRSGPGDDGPRMPTTSAPPDNAKLLACVRRVVQAERDRMARERRKDRFWREQIYHRTM